jgi:hypothetical protein
MDLFDEFEELELGFESDEEAILRAIDEEEEFAGVIGRYATRAYFGEEEE